MLEANPDLGWRDVQNILAASATHTVAPSARGFGDDENAHWFLNAATNWNGGGMHFSKRLRLRRRQCYNAVRMAEVWSLFTPAQTSANEQIYNIENDTDASSPTMARCSSRWRSHPIRGSSRACRTSGDITHSDFTQLRIFLSLPAEPRRSSTMGPAPPMRQRIRCSTGPTVPTRLHGEDVAGNWTIRIVDGTAGGPAR